MPDYGIVKNFIAITPSGIVAIPSGSKTNPESAISASVPQILAVTCSSNFNNRLTKLTTLNAFGTITLASGSSNFRDTRIILRYIDSSSFGSEEPGIFRKENPINEDDSAIDLRFSGSKINDTFIDIPLNNNDDSFLVAYRTVEALKTSKVFNKSFNVSLVDDGSSLSIISASLGNTMKIGSSFKIRNSASLGTNNLTDGAEGKFIITSLNSGSVALPDFSGTATQVGGMQIGSSFKIGSTEPVFQFNIIQAGSGKTNQRFYPGRVSVASASLVQRIDPDDNKSFEFLVPSQSIGGDDDLAALYVSSSRRIGFATKDPLTDVDIRADEFQVQRKTERRGLRINTEGNIESFDKNAATSATGSEFILKYSRGIAITDDFVNDVFGQTFSNDTDAQNFFNALKPDVQQKGLEQGERAGFIAPPEVGDVLGSIRFVAESGSIGDFDERAAGETAAIRAIVSDGSSDGISSDLIFSVANRAGNAQQKLLLDSNDLHTITGQVTFNNSMIVGTTITHVSNGNSFIQFLNSGNDIRFVNNSVDTFRLKPSEVVINEQSVSAVDFRVESNSDTHNIFSNSSTNRVGIGTGTPGEKLEVVGNISASGTIFANKIVTTEVTSSFITSSTSILIQNFTSSGDSDFKGNITASSHISASGDLFGVRALINNSLVTPRIATDTTLTITPNITASANISASGTITALSSNIVTINGGSF